MRKYSLNDPECFRLDQLVDDWLFSNDEEIKFYIQQLLQNNKDSKAIKRFVLFKMREWLQLNIDENPSVYRPY